MALEGGGRGTSNCSAGNPKRIRKSDSENRTISGANQPLFVVNGIVVEQAEQDSLEIFKP